MAAITAVLLNWQRPQNVARIIPALRDQTEAPWILLADNAERAYAGPEPDELWRVRPVNTGPFLRFLAAYNAETEWLYFQDDDLLPTDSRFLADLLMLAKLRPEAITGVFGRNVNAAPPHYRHRDSSGATNMVKTRCMLMRRETLGRVRFPAGKGNMGRADDLWVSLETSQGERIHHTHNGMRHRLQELSEHGVGISRDPEHYAERERFCAWYLDTQLVS